MTQRRMKGQAQMVGVTRALWRVAEAAWDVELQEGRHPHGPPFATVPVVAVRRLRVALADLDTTVTVTATR